MNEFDSDPEPIKNVKANVKGGKGKTSCSSSQGRARRLEVEMNPVRVCLPDQDGFFKFIPSRSKSDQDANDHGYDHATSSLEAGYVTEREFLEKIQEAEYGGNDNKTIIIGLFGKGSLGQADTKAQIFDELMQKDRFRGYKADNSDENAGNPSHCWIPR